MSLSEDQKQQFRDAVAVVTAAFNDEVLMDELLDDLEGRQVVYGLIGIIGSLLAWVQQTTGEPPSRIIQFMASRLEEVEEE